MKIAIVGSRGLNPTEADLAAMVPKDATEIVSGGAQGVDQAAARYARARQLTLTEIEPQYSAYGKAAPLRRNAQIVDAADMVIAIWDGYSRGTLHTMRRARQCGKPLRVYMRR